MQDCLSTKEVALRLGVTRARVMGWIYRRRLPAFKRGWCWYVVTADADAMKERRDSRRVAPGSRGSA